MALKLMAKAEIVTLIGAAVKAVNTGRDQVHAAAVQTMLHMREHGDITLAQRLIDDLNGNPGFNVKGLLFWYGTFAPLTARQGKFQLLETKSKAYKDYAERATKRHKTEPEVAEKVGGRFFWVEEANKTPFWSLAEVEKDQAGVIPNVTTAQLMGRVVGMGKLLDKAIADKRFGGDEKLARDYVKKLAEFNAQWRRDHAADLMDEQDTLAEARKKVGVTSEPTNQGQAEMAAAEVGGDVTQGEAGKPVDDDKRTGTEG
jgi:hypothetical protein